MISFAIENTSLNSTRAGSTQTYFSVAISLVLHFTLGVLLLSDPQARSEIESEKVITVSLTELPKEQYVSSSEATATNDPPLTTKLTERNAVTERETIKRGDAGGSSIGKSSPRVFASASSEAKQNAAMTAPKTPQITQKPKLKDFVLDTATVIQSFGKSDQNVKTQKENQPASRSPQPAAPFSRPQGSGALFLGNGGIRDSLPDLPDGDITLLNEKADRFAVFVRRVALQVFGQLRASGWESLSAQDIQSMRNPAAMRAILSPKGILLSVEQISSSGSSAFDSVVQAAVKKGARDFNPPLEAATTDGNIHFIFQAKSWAEFFPTGREGFPRERRWLLLETGLE